MSNGWRECGGGRQGGIGVQGDEGCVGTGLISPWSANLDALSLALIVQLSAMLVLQVGPASCAQRLRVPSKACCMRHAPSDDLGAHAAPRARVLTCPRNKD
jgi:hypothetical protein